MAGEERVRAELYATFKNRALMYWHIFDELRRAFALQDAWREAGVSDADLAALCRNS